MNEKKERIIMNPDEDAMISDEEEEHVQKPVLKERVPTNDKKDSALKNIYKFYSRQHIKSGLDFISNNDSQKLEKGELINFCKDFEITIPKNQILKIFMEASDHQ